MGSANRQTAVGRKGQTRLGDTDIQETPYQVSPIAERAACAHVEPFASQKPCRAVKNGRCLRFSGGGQPAQLTSGKKKL